MSHVKLLELNFGVIYFINNPALYLYLHQLVPNPVLKSKDTRVWSVLFRGC